MPRRPSVSLHHVRGSSLIVPRVAVKPVTIEFPQCHARQLDFITALDRMPKVRYVVGACGTKWGKTFGTTIAIARYAWDHPGTKSWWVSPTFSQADMAMELVENLYPEGTFESHIADKRIVLKTPSGKTHSTIEFKSGDNPNSLRGFGVNFFVMDEAARCPEASWTSLQTTCLQTKGRGYLISTPNGRGWFYNAFQKGIKFDRETGEPLYPNPADDPHEEWYSIRMPTWENPFVDADAIQTMKKNLTAMDFEQEVAAEFNQESAGVFHNISGCIKGRFQDAQPGTDYLIGLDLARKRDFSVLVVVERASNHVVHFDRFKDYKWSQQYRRIVRAAKTYNNAPVVLDATGLGDPIVETLKDLGVRTVPFKISGTSKPQLVDKLRVNLEQEKISFPSIPVLKKELESYELNISESGNVKYGAPPGQHDDTVIALALANWAASQAPWRYKSRSVRGV